MARDNGRDFTLMGMEVNTLDMRFAFVKKASASDVGDGTDYPMLVTLHQLSEIGYRVKDAWFTGGGFSYDDGFGSNNVVIVNQPSVGYERVSSEEISGDITISARGYFAEPDNVLVPNNAYFGTTYTATHGAVNVRDIGSYEPALWIPDTGVTFGTNSLEGQAFSDSIEWGTAFAQYLYCFGAPTPATAPNYCILNDGVAAETIGLYLSTPLEVAWINGHSPFDPDSSLYLKVRFQLRFIEDAVIDSLDTGTEAGMSLVFELSNSVVSCPLYDCGFKTITSPDNFTITATEWWPYSKGTPATSVWDETTGLPL